MASFSTQKSSMHGARPSRHSRSKRWQIESISTSESRSISSSALTVVTSW